MVYYRAYGREWIGVRGGVLVDRDRRMVPEGMPGGQRLLAEHVQGRMGDPARIQGRQEVRFDQMPAARRIDEIAAFGQAGEEIRGENALGLGRQGQEADEDPRAREETSQPLAAVTAGDPVDRFRRSEEQPSELQSLMRLS